MDKKVLWALKVYERRKEALQKKKSSQISFDEIWTYLKVRRGKKLNSVWIWTAVIDKEKVIFEVGERREETFLSLYEQLPETKTYYSDGYKVYHWLPSDIHQKGKLGAVNRNEAKHSALRRHLNRLARKTQGYSKSLLMLKGSIAPACLYL